METAVFLAVLFGAFNVGAKFIDYQQDQCKPPVVMPGMTLAEARAAIGRDWDSVGENTRTGLALPEVTWRKVRVCKRWYYYSLVYDDKKRITWVVAIDGTGFHAERRLREKLGPKKDHLFDEECVGT